MSRVRHRPIAIGRYARVTSMARSDAIGRVIRHTPVGAVVRLPAWQADGSALDLAASWSELQRSNADACRIAERRRII